MRPQAFTDTTKGFSLFPFKVTRETLRVPTLVVVSVTYWHRRRGRRETRHLPENANGHGHREPPGRLLDDLGACVVSVTCRQPRQQTEASGVQEVAIRSPVTGM
jgi:hypothetical protein